jgi:hypothetical protein
LARAQIVADVARGIADCAGRLLGRAADGLCALIERLRAFLHRLARHLRRIVLGGGGGFPRGFLGSLLASAQGQGADGDQGQGNGAHRSFSHGLPAFRVGRGKVV